jgi:hypothetical protein
MSQKNEGPKNEEEFYIFVQRFVHFQNLWAMYFDLLSGHYVPRVGPQSPTEAFPTFQNTLMFVLYGWFYSLIEDHKDGVNAFRIWRLRFPEEESAIQAVESEVIPFSKGLKTFRNRLGFHGSQTWAHEKRGFDLFNEHSGNEVIAAMARFRSLGNMLLDKDLKRPQPARND